MQVRHDMVQCYAIRHAGESHEVLQLLRRKDDYMGGTWQPVSGRIEAGETAWQAAVRELREESNLQPLELYALDMVQTFYIPAHDTLWHSIPFCAIVSPSAQVILNDEHDDHRWLPMESASQHAMWTGDRRAIAQIREIILAGSPSGPHLRIPL
jgi:dihydroneopterin triphosphate diphosphatase